MNNREGLKSLGNMVWRVFSSGDRLVGNLIPDRDDPVGEACSCPQETPLKSLSVRL